MSSAAARGGRQIVPRPDAWRAGGPAPWEEPAAASSFALSVVVEAVAGFDVADDVPRPAPDARRSAVLLALHDGPEGAEVVLTRRAQALRRHHGEISFPGGRLEPGETPEAGALREAHEEVALDPRVVELVGRLSTLSAVSSLSHIVPVVGRLPGRPRLWPAQAEVERILHLPLFELTRDGVFREERWGEAAGERAIYFFELADETIWGATARILVELLTVVLAA